MASMKVSFFDGRTVSVPAAESLRSVRTHVAAATGLQANELCFSCAGTLLNDAENHAHVGEWVHKILAAKQASHDDKHRRGADEAASAAMPPVMVWTRRCFSVRVSARRFSINFNLCHPSALEYLPTDAESLYFKRVPA
eukprot:6214782-Pleurochrysis_carterae.AAC.1